MGQFFSEKIELSQEIIQKLSLIKEKEDKTKILFIFDYDDTFLPTNHFSKSNYKVTGKDFPILESIGQKVKFLLTFCLTQGTVYLISNSSKSWLLRTSVNYLQLSLDFLNKLKIISVRELYGDLPMNKRKEQAFNVMNNEFTNAQRVINIGDSNDEFFCAQRIRMKYKHLSLVNIKMIEVPSPTELDKELKYLIEHIEELINSNEHLNIELNTEQLNEYCKI
jgi:hypothetical protein